MTYSASVLIGVLAGCSNGATGGTQGSGAPGMQWAATGASCEATVDCYGACNSAADCLAACDGRAAAGAAVLGRAVLDCVGRSGCQDQACVITQCEAELTACASRTIAAAPPLDPAPAPDPGGGQITAASLAGEWRKGDHSAADYVNGGGGLVTSNVTVSQQIYRFDGAGAYVEQIDGASNQGQVHASNPGSYSLEPEFLVLTTDRERRYRIVGWQVTDELTVMTLLYSSYPVDNTNIMYNGEVWVRVR